MNCNFRSLNFRAVLTCGLLSAPAFAANYQLSNQSVFAVVTNRAGLGAKLAHNHFIHAANAKSTLDYTDGVGGSLNTTFQANDLVVDDATIEKLYEENVTKNGCLSSPFAVLSKDDQKKIKDNMLSKDQLFQASFPEITIKVTGLKSTSVTMGSTTYPMSAELALTVRGKTVTKTVGTNVKVNGKNIEIEGAGQFKFTDFGFKPYSALLGAIRNADDFCVYLNAKGQQI